MKDCGYCGVLFEQEKYDVEGFCCLLHKMRSNQEINYKKAIENLNANDAYWELNRTINYVTPERYQILFDIINTNDEALEKFVGDSWLMYRTVNRMLDEIDEHIVSTIKIEYLHDLLIRISMQRRTTTSIDRTLTTFYKIFEGHFETGDRARDEEINAIQVATKLTKGD